MTYKEIGTLAEIGAQVGDVVELVSVWEDQSHSQIGTIWEVDECGYAMPLANSSEITPVRSKPRPRYASE